MGQAAPRPPAAEAAVTAVDVTAVARALARRVRAGATLWLLTPAGEADHPLDGLRESTGPALPLALLDADDPVTQARTAARAGDVLVLGSVPDDPLARELARRAPAWGVSTCWVGGGAGRPPVGGADLVVWAPHRSGAPGLAEELAGQVRRHLADPDLTADPGPSQDEVCLTCSDQARLVEVVSAPDGLLAPAVVRGPAGEETVDVTLVGEVRPGDLVLVHAGTALTRLEER
ncbi:MAG TPA: HypC/HybG/HupF family hydrogenase formation chaperone [Nocardioides sp.]|uniref:HypC/HybG/HupF family hydrogenase formation chaperone n=1 Tax=Nocardioides sp. TaxID=35761 RepID=UPI002C98E1AD|nr:HypC/HybG/HupF family hydrogenase formation chaperone [Nocardioides sp.]HQR27028.1 HypC/HybG/HupF family hydrogenase formation chaperone [Nocardioides sp.]